MKDKILILGSTGQLGMTFLETLGNRAIPLGRGELDLTQIEEIEGTLDAFDPNAVINCSAYNAVDKAEKESDLAFLLNATAPERVSQWCQKKEIPFVHYSTDYVFSGEGNRPWTEDAIPTPLSAYGKSKLAGEQKVQAIGGKYLIFRTSWVFSELRSNFVTRMISLGQEKTEAKMVKDQIGAPTYTRDLAQATLQALKLATEKPSFPSGVFHLCNSGETSRHQFAEEILVRARDKGLPLQLKNFTPTLTSDFPTPARRPLNSRLSTDKIRHTFDIQMRDWQEALKDCMERLDG